MDFLTMNRRWFLIPLLTTCAFNSMMLCLSNNPGNATSILQTKLLIASSNCSAADLSRSSPPFKCVTSTAFKCLKANSAGRGGSLEYRGDTSGEIVVKSDVAGAVALLGFNYNASSETLNLSVKKKNFAVQEQQIWDGFKSTLSRCR